MDREQKQSFCMSKSVGSNFNGHERILSSQTVNNKVNKQKRSAFSFIGGSNNFTCYPSQLDAYARNHNYVGEAEGRTASSAFSRAFPQTPDRVLDAPGIVDDFYLNVLDWGKKNILAVGLGPSVYLWNGKTGAVSELMSIDNGHYITSIRWIHDGTSIAIGGSEGFVQIWDVEKGRKIRTILAAPANQRVGSLAWNKHLLSTGSRDGSIGTNDVRLPKPLILQHQSQHQQQVQEVCGLEWSPDGQQLASGGNDNLIHIWDAGQASPRFIFSEHKSAVKAIAWCPWKQGVLATGGGSQDRQIRTWNTITGQSISSTSTDSSISSLVWSKTSKELLSSHGQPTNQLRLWKVTATSQSSCNLVKSSGLEHAHSRRILHMTISPDGQTIVTAGADESIKFWKVFDPPSASSDRPDGKKSTRQDNYILMPKFSRSRAIDKAMQKSNRVVM